MQIIHPLGRIDRQTQLQIVRDVNVLTQNIPQRSAGQQFDHQTARRWLQTSAHQQTYVGMPTRTLTDRLPVCLD